LVCGTLPINRNSKGRITPAKANRFEEQLNCRAYDSYNKQLLQRKQYIPAVSTRYIVTADPVSFICVSAAHHASSMTV